MFLFYKCPEKFWGLRSFSWSELMCDLETICCSTILVYCRFYEAYVWIMLLMASKSFLFSLKILYFNSNQRQKHPMSVLLWVVCYSLEYWCRLLIQPRHEINLCGLTSLILIHLDATAGSNRNTLAYEQIDYSGSETGRIVPARLESNSSTLSSTGNVKPLNLRCVWTLNHQRNFCSADRKWACS